MKVYRWEHPNVEEHILCWLQGFAELADGLVTLLSFGFLLSDFELRYCAWRTLRKIRKYKSKEKV